MRFLVFVFFLAGCPLQSETGKGDTSPAEETGTVEDSQQETAVETDTTDTTDTVETGACADADADGHADIACGGDDCDDSNAAVNPTATEVCNAIDDNCNGEVDNDATDASTYYIDVDGDGYGDDADWVRACTMPDGYVTVGGDCDDWDWDYHPGADEDCWDGLDLNCDGSVGLVDADGDFVAACDDCNDADASVSPDASEVCNAIDDNCDGEVDNDAVDASTFYIDDDGDGYGNDSRAAVVACDRPSGYAEIAGDCNDYEEAVYPGAWEDPSACADETDYNCDGENPYNDSDVDGDGVFDCQDHEECDGIDNDGDELIDEDLPDTDGDGTLDCYDVEECDGVDNDGDGLIDEDLVQFFSYPDIDGDGYGSPASGSSYDCAVPVGYTTITLDCDDANPGTYPGAVEVCDGVDNDCNGAIDEGLLAYWYIDADGDGYGDDTTFAYTCEPMEGSVLEAGDCDDTDAAFHPGAEEMCNGSTLEDYNCDGSFGFDDLDADGYPACSDCNDADAAVNPDAFEVCNVIDDNCDGEVDNDAVDALAFYADADMDGHGDVLGEATVSCKDPAEVVDYVVDSNDDCNDADAAVNPDATEVCNTIDDNCDSVVDEGGVCDVVDTGDTGDTGGEKDTDTGGDTGEDTGGVETGTETGTDTSVVDTGDTSVHYSFVSDFGDGAVCTATPFARGDGGTVAVYDSGSAVECGVYAYSGGTTTSAPSSAITTSFSVTSGDVVTVVMTVGNVSTTDPTDAVAALCGEAPVSVALKASETGTELALSATATSSSCTLEVWATSQSIIVYDLDVLAF